MTICRQMCSAQNSYSPLVNHFGRSTAIYAGNLSIKYLNLKLFLRWNIRRHITNIYQWYHALLNQIWFSKNFAKQLTKTSDMLIHDIKNEDKKPLPFRIRMFLAKIHDIICCFLMIPKGQEQQGILLVFIAAITTSFEKMPWFSTQKHNDVCVCGACVGNGGGGLLYFCWGDFMTVSIKQTLHTFFWDDRSLGNQIFGFIIFNSSWISFIFRGHIPLSLGDFVHPKLHIYTSSI